MRLHRLRITSFAAIGSLDVELGPGLNVLYGPNDLGKSTVVAAIRLGLRSLTRRRIASSTSGGQAVTIRLSR